MSGLDPGSDRASFLTQDTRAVAGGTCELNKATFRGTVPGFVSEPHAGSGTQAPVALQILV